MNGWGLEWSGGSVATRNQNQWFILWRRRSCQPRPTVITGTTAKNCLRSTSAPELMPI